jgi:hypothetical protein
MKEISVSYHVIIFTSIQYVQYRYWYGVEHNVIYEYSKGPEAGFLVWLGYVPVLNYVPFR